MTAPEISGVEDGKTYCLTRTITVIDEHLRDVKVNGKRIELDEIISMYFPEEVNRL